MKFALLFLNGYYDWRYPQFYKQEIAWGKANGYPLICADGGLQLFPRLFSQNADSSYRPDVLIGDLDSVDGEAASLEGVRVVREWVGQVDKDYTDGQLAVACAIEAYGCNAVCIYGGLPRPHSYEIDHFLGNLKLMRFGLRLLASKGEGGIIDAYTAEMRDPLQTVHFVASRIRLERKNAGLQRVSLIAEGPNAVVKTSENLRWPLTRFHVDPDSPNALRNEFIVEAAWAEIRLKRGSDPVYVIHNWYEI